MQRRIKAVPTGMLDTQRISLDRYWRFARLSMLIGAGLHVAFAAVGLLLGATPLAQLQVVSITVYIACYALSAHGLRWLVAPLIWLDLLGHATIACWLLGLDSGFQFYSWILMALLFGNASRSVPVKIGLAIVLAAIFIGIDMGMRNHAPLVVLSESAMTALRYFNITCYFAAMGGMALAHARAASQAESKLRATAGTDVLTGLLNRRRMSDRMQQEMNLARSGQRSMAVMLLDIDEFKLINDRYGHGRGDQVIIHIGQVLTQTVRDSDVVARWGGEEFLILLPDTHVAAAQELSERIRSTIATTVSGDEAGRNPVTVTIGVAAWRASESLEETIHRADKALYRGKHSGRNRVELDESSTSLRAVS